MNWNYQPSYVGNVVAVKISEAHTHSSVKVLDNSENSINYEWNQIQFSIS